MAYHGGSHDPQRAHASLRQSFSAPPLGRTVYTHTHTHTHTLNPFFSTDIHTRPKYMNMFLRTSCDKRTFLHPKSKCQPSVVLLLCLCAGLLCVIWVAAARTFSWSGAGTSTHRCLPVPVLVSSCTHTHTHTRTGTYTRSPQVHGHSCQCAKATLGQYALQQGGCASLAVWDGRQIQVSSPVGWR